MEGVLGPLAAKLDANKRVIRGAALVPGTVNTSTQSEVFAALPAAANGKFLGAAAEDLTEPGFKFDSTTDPTTVTGTTPASPYDLSKKNVSLVQRGRFPMIAAGAIALGDIVNIADVYGRVKTVNEGAGTTINAIGRALSVAAAANDIVYVDVGPFVYKA